MDPAFGERHLNDGFSGGERKRNEILQMAMLEPELAVLDETDSGPRRRRPADRGPGRPHGARGPARSGRAGDHPLPAHARRAGRRSGPPAGRRGHRGRGRPGAGPAARDRRATTHGGTERDPHRLDVAALRKDFPLLAREVDGRPIVYLDSAASAQRPGPGARRHARATTRPPTPTSTAGVYAHRRGGHPPLRGGPGHRRPVHRRRRSPTGRSSSPRTPPRPQPGGPHLGPRPPARGGRHRPHRDGAPRQHRPLADAGRGAGPDHPVDPGRRRRRTGPRRPRAAGRRGQAGRGDLHVQRAGHPQSDRRASPRRPTPPGPWWWPTAPSRCPTSRPTCRPSECDFLAFSAHKMLGPTGIGVLWGREALLEALPPFLGGGEMILDVRKDGFTPNDIPWRFEAGTPPITEAIGLGAAVDYLERRRHGRGPAARDRPDHLRHGHAAPSGSATTSASSGPRTRRPGAACSPSPTGTSTPTTSPRSSTSTACASGPATTAPSR